MAVNSKLKILYILDIMKKTDEHHPLNTTQLAEKLSAYGVVAERKSIARDIQCLEDAGFSIVHMETMENAKDKREESHKAWNTRILCTYGSEQPKGVLVYKQYDNGQKSDVKRKTDKQWLL